MRKFVTYITKYSGNKLPMFYIGSTSEDKAKSGKYFGSISSKKWTNIFYEELRQNKHLFSLEILSIHNTQNEAINEELRLHIESDVVKSKDFFNESLAQPSGFFGKDNRGKNNPFYGRKHSEESKTLISKNHANVKGEYGSFYGRKHSEKSKIKIGDAQRGKKLSDSTKKKISEANKGHQSTLGLKHKESTKIKISKGNKGRIKTKEELQKLSVSLKKFYLENGPPVPWNKGRKMSEVEKQKMKDAKMKSKNKIIK